MITHAKVCVYVCVTGTVVLVGYVYCKFAIGVNACVL